MIKGVVALLATVSLVSTACKTRDNNESAAQSLQDARYELRLIETAKKGELEFLYCKKPGREQAIDIKIDCRNPFYTKDGVRGRFYAIDKRAQQKLASKGYQKGAVVVMTGGTLVVVGTVVAAAFGLETLIAHGGITVVSGSQITTGIMVGLGTAATGAATAFTQWGANDREAAHAWKEVFSMDPKNTKKVESVKNLLPSLASALDLEVWDKMVTEVENI